MPAPILPISVPPISGTTAATRATPGSGFGEVFNQAVRTVEGLNQDASASVNRFLSGEGEDLHSTILATTRAELGLDLFLQTRNKVVSAYQEIMRMQM